MFENEIITPNERVRKNRIALEMTQDELAQGVCSIPNLSHIENGKQSLTVEMAKGFADNFNKKIEEKNIDVGKVTEEELLKDIDTKANEVYNIYILELKVITDILLFDKKFEIIEELINNYKISNKKIEVYEIASDFYFRKRSYSKNEKVCSKGLEYSLSAGDKIKQASFYIDKSRIYIKIYQYKEALKELNNAENLNLEDKKINSRIYFNKALVYKKLGEYNTSMKYLEIALNELDDNDINSYKKLIDIKMLYANCLNEEKRYNELENIYIEILDKAMLKDDEDTISLVYRNLSEYKFNQKKYKLAAQYIDKSIAYNPFNIHLTESLYYAGIIYNQYDNSGIRAKEYFIKSLERLEKFDNENKYLMEKVLYELVLIYIKENDDINIEIISNKVEIFNLDRALIFSELIKYYIELNKNKCMEYNRKIINYTKHIKKIDIF